MQCNNCFQILDALITGCRDSDEEIQVACGECLGEIGAVDPGRLPNKVAINGIGLVIFQYLHTTVNLSGDRLTQIITNLDNHVIHTSVYITYIH